MGLRSRSLKSSPSSIMNLSRAGSDFDASVMSSTKIGVIMLMSPFSVYV